MKNMAAVWRREAARLRSLADEYDERADEMERAAQTDHRALTVAEVAAELRRTDAHVYNLIKRGRLPAIRSGERGGLCVERADLDRFKRSRRTTGSAGPLPSMSAGGAPSS